MFLRDMYANKQASEGGGNFMCHKILYLLNEYKINGEPEIGMTEQKFRVESKSRAINKTTQLLLS